MISSSPSHAARRPQADYEWARALAVSVRVTVADTIASNRLRLHLYLYNDASHEGWFQDYFTVAVVGQQLIRTIHSQTKES